MHFCGDANHYAEKFKRMRKEKLKSRAAADSDKRLTERTTHKNLRCESEDHLIVKCPKPPK